MSRPADWLGALGDHHRRGRAWHPHDQLLIVFEVEGAILGHGRTAIADQGLPDGGVVQQRQALVHRPQAAQCLLQPVAASVAPRANCFMGQLAAYPDRRQQTPTRAPGELASGLGEDGRRRLRLLRQGVPGRSAKPADALHGRAALSHGDGYTTDRDQTSAIRRRSRARRRRGEALLDRESLTVSPTRAVGARHGPSRGRCAPEVATAVGAGPVNHESYLTVGLVADELVALDLGRGREHLHPSQVVKRTARGSDDPTTLV